MITYINYNSKWLILNPLLVLLLLLLLLLLMMMVVEVCVCVLGGPQDMLCKLSHFIQSKYLSIFLH